MSKIFSSQFSIKVYKQRDFDTQFKFHAIQTELYDISINLIAPNYADHDTLFVPVRMMTSEFTIPDIDKVSKEDTSSFFSTYVAGADNLINSKFVSRDLQVISDTSERLRQPLSNFDQVKAITTNTLQYSSSDAYVLIDFTAVFGCTSLKLFSKGLTTILCNNKNRVTVNDHATLLSCFDIDNIYYAGVYDGTSLPAISIGNFCSMYAGVLYIPTAANYYFGIDGKHACELEIDGVVVSSYYGTHSAAGTPQGTVTLFLSKGFHTIIARQATTSIDGSIVAYFRVRTNDSWLALTESNCQFKGLALRCLSYTANDIKNEGDSFFIAPDKIAKTNLYYLSLYTPLIFLARPGSAILSNDLKQFTFLLTPDLVTIPNLNTGSIIGLLDDSTFSYGEVGVATNVDFASLENSGIQYSYNNPVSIDFIELKDTRKLGTITYDSSQALTLGLQCRDRSKKFIGSTSLVNSIDLTRSQNISKVEHRDATSIRITKTVADCETIIYFTESLVVTSINLFPTALVGAIWGYITSFRVFNAPSDIKTFDASGKSVNFFESTPDSMKMFKFKDISYIPTIFEPEKTPLEVIYNAEYLLYTMQFTGQIPLVEFYGMSYRITNENNYQPMYHTLVALDISEFTGRQSIRIYGDAHRNIAFPYAFIAFDRTTNETVLTDYSSISYTIQNAEASTLLNVLITLPAPNLGYSYTGSDGVCGLNQDNSIAVDVETWDSNNVIVLVSSLPPGSTTIILTRGEFSSSIIGDMAPSTVKVTPKLIYLPSVLVYMSLLAPTISQEFCALLESTALPSPMNPLLSISNDITLGFVDITELSGNTAVNVQVRADVSEVLFHYGSFVPFVVYDRNAQSLETIYVNSDGTFTNSISNWNGKLIQFKVTLPGGDLTRFYLRAKNENGNIANFTTSLYLSYASNVIAIDCGLRAVGEVNSLIDYKILSGFPTLIYKHTGINETIVETIGTS